MTPSRTSVRCAQRPISRRLLWLCALVALLIGVPAALAASSDLDATFGTGGKVKTDFGAADSIAEAVAVQPDGKIVVAGTGDGIGGADIYLARYNPDGSLDTTFDGDGRVITIGAAADRAHAIALQPDGKIVVAGETDGDLGILRYNSDGSLDASFGKNGVAIVAIDSSSDTAYAVALQPDGKIVAAGTYYNTTESDLDLAVVRVNSDGSPDGSFSGDGIREIRQSSGVDRLNSVLIEPDGSILTAGVTDIGGNSGFVLVRLENDGDFNTSMNGVGILTFQAGDNFSTATSVLRQPDGRIVLAGSGDTTGMYEFGLTRLESNGDLDASFGTGGLFRSSLGPNPDFLNGAVLQSNGKIVVAGEHQTLTGSEFAVMRLNSDGKLDAGFGAGGVVTHAFDGPSSNYAAITAMALQPDAKIVVAGKSTIGLETDFAVARYMGDWAPTPAAPAPALAPSAAITSPSKSKLPRKKLKRFAGTAGPTGSVAKVEIGLLRVDNKLRKRGYCRWLKSNKAAFKKVRDKAKKCTKPRFLKASGTESWSFKLKRVLAKGSYKLFVRVTLTDGSAHTTYSAAQGNLRAFRLTN